MAKLTGALKGLTGSIDNLIFYTNAKGDTIVQRKGGPTRAKFLKSSNYERSRENSSEFASAAKASSYVGGILRLEQDWAREKGWYRSLQARMMRIVKTDELSERGRRHVANGDLSLLEGFRFREEMPLSRILNGGWELIPDDGKLKVNIYPFGKATYAGYATHIEIHLFVAAIDFLKSDRIQRSVAHGPAALAIIGKSGLELEVDMKGMDAPCFIAMLGARFHREVAPGRTVPLKDNSFNAMDIIAAWRRESAQEQR